MDTARGLVKLDRDAEKLMAKTAIPALRLALGITYIWFGALTILGVSPVAGLVEKMAMVVPGKLFGRLMGFWEVGLGVAVLFRLALRLTLVLFVMQLAGTFMVFLAHPREAFQKGNPLRLTQTGEFILKNLVLLAGVMAVGATMRTEREEVVSSASTGSPVREEQRV